MECNKLKDNYSLSLKSISMTISPFLIILTMTHIMKLVSSAAFVSITWNVIWILVMLTFLSNLNMVRIYMSIWTYKMAGFQYWWIFECSGTLGFFNGSSLFVEACWKVKTTSVVLSYSTTHRTGVILLKLVVCQWSKSLHQLFPWQQR
jgi:hypothetical protein